MASFKAKISWKSPRKNKNKNYHFNQFQLDPLQRIPKKKNSKKLKNTTMASFPAKTGWDRPKKGENENYRSNQFQLNSLQRIPKKQQKNKKHHSGFFSSQNRQGKAEKERK